MTEQGERMFRVQLSDGQRRGEAFGPSHWTDQQSTGGRTGRLPRPLVDPFSGQPGFKSTPLRIEPLVTEWTGFLVSAVEPSSIAADYATSSRVLGGWLVELAGSGDTAKLARSEEHTTELQSLMRNS